MYLFINYFVNMNIIHVFQTQTSVNIDSQYRYFIYVGSYTSSNYVLVKMVLFVCKSNSRICLVIIWLVLEFLLMCIIARLCFEILYMDSWIASPTVSCFN